ncbi:MAG: ABC transporter ATP-binding protein [Acholeplasma sp.]|nr:ABC transporter ATP-binding protein [Acholeplasma sp.]
MARDIILEVNNLKKSYGDVEAVKGISFQVKKGSLFAFLGPNGAGKSTTIKIITTLLKADSGSFAVNGESNENYIREKIGVVFQENVLDDFLTVEENLIYRGALYINNKAEVIKRYNELVESLRLKEIANKKFKELSGGQKRRVEIARALFSNPEILLLDEPTTGLDPETRQQVWHTLSDLKEKENITIFLTTHYMEEAANADYVIIIDKGLIKVSGTPSELKNEYSEDVLKVVPKDKKVLDGYLKSKKVSYKIIADQYLIVINETKEAIDLIVDIKDNINQFEVVKGTLDDVFVRIVGDDDVSSK